MALVHADRVKETSTTTGTGAYTLLGAVTGFQSFAAIGDGNLCWYEATDGTNWESGVGTYTAAGTTLARTTILASSNAGAAVNWAAGTRTLFVTPVAARFPEVISDFKNLVVKPTASSLCTVTADELVLTGTNEGRYLAKSVNLAAIDVSTSGANGLDTGAEASSTWYSIWVIFNPGTATVAGLLSVSATAPTMPSGYTFKVRVGWIRNDGSSNYLRTLQSGRTAHYVLGTNPLVAPLIANGTTGTYSATSPTLATASVTSVVPTGTASRIYVAAINTWKAGSIVGVLVAPNTSWGGTNNGPTGTAGQFWPIFLANLSATGSGNFFVSASAWIDLEATTIAWASGGAGGAIGCLGWEDNI